MSRFKNNILRETIIAALCGFAVLVSAAPSLSYAADAVSGGGNVNAVYEEGLANRDFILIDPLGEYKITLRLENGKAYGYAGINRYSASYEINGGHVEFDNIASTRMAGPENNMKAERQYLRLLEGKHAFSSENGILKIGQLAFKEIDDPAKRVR